MASSFSNLVNNLTGGIHKIKCKYGHDNKNCKTCKIKYKDCEGYLEYTNIKNNLIEHKCLFCNKIYQKSFDKNLKTRVINRYKFPNHDMSKFILLLRKVVCPYEYMGD